MGYQYTYLLMGLVFFIIWLSLFIWRKNTRKEMVIMSLLSGLSGPIGDILYTKDWWNPLTLTNTAIGFEAVLAGFMIGGIGSVIYVDLFKKRLKPLKNHKTDEARKNFNLISILITIAVLFFGSFYLLNLNSLWATILALFVPTAIIWIKRKDLVLDSLVTGILLVIVAFFVYSVLELLTPGWVHVFWLFKNVPEIIIFNLPIDDMIWYFFAGLFAGPIYEYWQESKLV